jgi:hypothetical protein
MSDWLPLRDSLTEHFAEQIDHAILHAPDPDLRAYLTAHRAGVLDRLVDKAELIALRQVVATQETPQALSGRANGKAAH